MIVITKVIIICPHHGNFYQTPNDHLCGKGCPRCVHHISSPCRKWLDSIGVPDDDEHREVPIPIIIEGRSTRYFADGLVENTVYEFYGDYWHGNPKLYKPEGMNEISKKTYGELYSTTQKRAKALKESGYNVVEMWESDWKEKGHNGRPN